MLKFTTAEALQIVKQARDTRRSRRRHAAVVKLAQALDDRAMEKRSAIITIPVLIAAGLSAAAAAGVQWLIMRGEPEKAQELVKTELANLKTEVKSDYADKMKNMQPRVYMATPKKPSPAPEPTTQPAPAYPQRSETGPSWADYHKARVALVRKWQRNFEPRLPYEFARDMKAWYKNQPTQAGGDPVFNYFRSNTPRAAQIIEKQLEPMKLKIQESARRRQARSAGQPQRSPGMANNPLSRLMGQSPLDQLLRSLPSAAPAPWNQSPDGSGFAPKMEEYGSYGISEGQPDTSLPWLPKDPYKMDSSLFRSAAPKYSSASSMTKGANIGSASWYAAMTAIKPIIQKLIAGGAEITPQFMKRLGSRVGGSAARGIGAGAAGSKWALGKLMLKLPTNFLKGTGSRMVASTSPYFSGGAAGGQMMLPGMSSMAREQLGRSIAGRTAGGVGNLIGTLGSYGLAGEGLNYALGGNNETQMPEGLSEDEMMQAQRMMSWLEATRGGNQDAQPQYLPRVDPALASKLPGFDLTEVPMGASYAADESPNQAGLPQV